MGTGCFLSYRLHKLIGLPGKDDPTYSLQLLTNGKSELEKYQSEFETDFIAYLNKNFKNKYVDFRTTMVVIDESSN